MTHTANPPGTVEGASPRPPYLWATVAGAAVFLLYALTLSPTTAFWDTSEYIATGWIMGIPHPPGNPLFVVLARAWVILLDPLGLSVAVRVNLFSAFMSATAHGLWFLVIHHVLRFFSEDRFFRLVGAGVSVMVSATAFTVWNQSNVNEKVYTVSLLTIALLSWLVIRWQERLDRGKDDNLLVLMVFILALSVGNHLMAFLAAPAIAVFILLVSPRAPFLIVLAFFLAMVGTNQIAVGFAAAAVMAGIIALIHGPAEVLKWKLYPPVVAAGLVGLSIHLFLPIRAELDPVINEGAPECVTMAEAVVSVATYGGAGCAPLSNSLNRSQYKIEGEPGAGLTGPRQSPLPDQITNYLQYFDWQWARSVAGRDHTFPPARVLFTLLFTGLGIWGAMEHSRRDPKSFAYLGTLFATLSLGLVYYLNFKYGYSLPDPVGDFNLHEVRERDYFFIVSFSLWGLWAGVGLATIWRSLAELVGGPGKPAGQDDAGGSGEETPEHPTVGAPAFRRTAPVLLVGLTPLLMNFSWADRSYDYAARDWAHNLLMSVEPYALLFTNGDNDTFPLWYLQEVEGIRRDVSVVVTSYLNTDWYAKQVRDLTGSCPSGVSAEDDYSRIICQRRYTADNTDAMYTHDPAEAEGRGKVPLVVEDPVSVPTGGLLELEDDVLERVAGAYIPLDEGQIFTLGPVRASMPPGSFLLPWQQFALAMVRSAFETGRPVYFASSGNAATSLGLDPYLVREGLAFRVNPGPLDEAPLPGAEAMPAGSPLNSITGDWIRTARTRTLAEEVFTHRSGIPAWDHWPDHSTVGIPNYYAWVYYALAQSEYGKDEEAVERYRQLGDDWSLLGS